MKPANFSGPFLFILGALTLFAGLPCAWGADTAIHPTKLTTLFNNRVPTAWGTALPGITRRLPDTTQRVLALTLDACGGGYDRDLLAFLSAAGVPATLFVTNAWAAAHPGPLKELAANPLFHIEAHGARHKPASVNGRAAYGIRGTNSPQELVAEVEDNMQKLAATTGLAPTWFRSGTAHYDEMAVEILQAMGMKIAGFSLSADDGASLDAPTVRNRLLAAKNGDIVLAHMNRPQSGTGQGLRQAIPLLLERGWRFTHLPR